MSNKLPETSGAEDVDLGQLFKLIGNAFERFFNFLKKILSKLFLAFVWVVFFIKKNLFKIALAGVLGFGVGFLQEKISKPVYESTIALNQNYGTGENLYDLIEYYNSMVVRNDSISLSRNLGLSKQQINTIVGFEVQPIVNENRRIKRYDEYIKSLDSTLASTIDYETFLENTQQHDYSSQKVTIRTSAPGDLRQVFEKIIENLNSSEYFKRVQEKDINQLLSREAAIKQSLKESEDLRLTYKKVLEAKEENEKGSQTSVTIEGANSEKKTKEFELFMNDLVLRRELVDIDRTIQDKRQITEIVSNELSSGIVENKIEILGEEINRNIFYALTFALIAFLLLSGMEFVGFLEKYKDRV